MNLELEGFRVIDEIGRGGFGTVYRAEDVAHGRDVAIKVLEGVPNDDARRRFDRERRAMGTLSGHPHIAVVHTSGALADGRPYLVMEMLQGGSLADRLRRDGPLPLDEVLSIGDALCEALDHAHQGRVLHLDLKPENVLFSSFGRAKVVDFGIAALIDDETGTTTIRATPAFADPVVLDGHPGTVQSDVYGLASTLFALLTARQPYGEDSGALAVLRRVATEPVPRVERPDVPPAVADAIQRGMAKDPADRHPSVAEFRRELDWARRQPVAAPAAPHRSPATATNWSPATAPVDPAFVPVTAPAPAGPDRSTVIGISLLAVSAVLLVLIIASQL